MSQISIGAIAIALLLATGACGKSEQKSEGPAEKAGATLGKAIDQAAEKAGEALKDGAEKAKEGLSEALDKMKDKK